MLSIEQQNIIYKSAKDPARDKRMTDVDADNADDVDVDDEEQQHQHLDQIDENRRLLMLMYDLNQTRTMPRSNSMIF